ncbi:S-layer homology domain-containing protein [Paenibacillus sp. FA6]|uniref:S-layer homology domain-containing protein n=1 Tax=Paenibacillus sp. FA6 TaxID=3413029 RepID=UPI003F65F43D
MGTAPFPEVKDADWFNDVIHTASAYRLINGFKDGTFRLEDKITREQAMVMIAKAMEITKGKSQTPNTKIRLQAYADASDVSDWARASIVDCLNAGIVSGRSSTELAPKAFMTRVEVTAIVQRLL